MTPDESKMLVLRSFAMKMDAEGAPAICSFAELCETTDLPPADLQAILKNLQAMGCIKLSRTYSAWITQEGYARAKPGDPSVPFQGRNQVVFNAPVQGSPVAFDGGTAEINVTHVNFLQQLADAIEAHPDLPQDKKSEWLLALREILRHPLFLEIARKIRLPFGI